jgi:hypothetical protein
MLLNLIPYICMLLNLGCFPRNLEDTDYVVLTFTCFTDVAEGGREIKTHYTKQRYFLSVHISYLNFYLRLFVYVRFSQISPAISWRSSQQGGVTLSSSEAEFVAASQAGQKVVYLRVLLRRFGYTQKKPTEIWEDNASCIMMSENPTNLVCLDRSRTLTSTCRDRSRHVDVKVHYLHDLVRDGHVKLVKCAGTQNVSDALTKSLAKPAFEKHREYMWGTLCLFQLSSGLSIIRLPL